MSKIQNFPRALLLIAAITFSAVPASADGVIDQPPVAPTQNGVIDQPPANDSTATEIISVLVTGILCTLP